MNAIGPFPRRAVQAFLDRACDLCAEPPAAAAGPFERVAERWASLGLRPGDLVLLALPNGAELLRQFFGVLAAGGVPLLVPAHTPAARLRELVRVMSARAVGGVRLPRAVAEEGAAGTVEGVRAAVFPPDAPPAGSAGEVAILTSGTSGTASGCLFTLEALALNAERHADAIGQRAADVVLVNLPLQFSYALVAQALATLVRGGRLVIGGPPFHPERYARAAGAHRVTVSSLTPVLARALLEWGGALPGGLRVLTVGGDALAPEHTRALLARRPGGELYLTYGLTQAGPRVATLAAHREPAARHASVGLPLAGTEVELEPVAGRPGMKQLLVASATVMRRRIGRVEGRHADDWRRPGVLATGDVFERDAAGHLFFKGRLGDFIVRGDRKICLAAVRRLATELPHVLRAETRVVTGRGGETDFDLALTLAEGAGADAASCRERLRRILGRDEFPRAVEVAAARAARAAYK